MKIAVGIPCFHHYEPEVAHDYMRMWYHFGRRMPEHEFFFIPKVRSEQFRARNAIVDTARKMGADYLLFLDDDHIFDWREIPNHEAYGFLQTLIDHDKDIVGALYYHRTGQYKPVLMRETDTPGDRYHFLTDDEITGGLQKVDVQGGGVMLINMRVFDRIEPPYFEPEQQTDGASLGTDIQLCRKARQAGFEVWCDTGLVVGHLKNDREVVHSENREMFMADNALRAGMAEDWLVSRWLKQYRQDAREYLDLGEDEDWWETIVGKALDYKSNNHDDRRPESYEDVKDYYRNMSTDQIARQVHQHCKPMNAQNDLIILNQFKHGFRGHGLDFGCGSAPIGFEMARRGHTMDLVDIDGAPAYEFTKWRAKKHGIECGWALHGPYDFVLALDSIEHLQHWEQDLDNIIGRMKPHGVLVTNFFDNQDFQNPEHINMRHGEVAQFLADRNMIPKSNTVWIKDDDFLGGAMRQYEDSAA